jgi:hypothetical protein
MDRNKPGVAGVIVRNDNRVLMCQRGMNSTLPGMWSIPGGKLEENEIKQGIYFIRSILIILIHKIERGSVRFIRSISRRDSKFSHLTNGE